MAFLPNFPASNVPFLHNKEVSGPECSFYLQPRQMIDPSDGGWHCLTGVGWLKLAEGDGRKETGIAIHWPIQSWMTKANGMW